MTPPVEPAARAPFLDALLQRFRQTTMDRRWQDLLDLDRLGLVTARAPVPACNWDAQTYTIEAFGIHAEDVDRDTAIEIWMRAARRQLAGPVA